MCILQSAEADGGAAAAPDRVAALRQSEERLRLAQAASGVGVFDWDLTTRAFYWSDQCRTLIGAGPEEPVDDARFLDRLHPADRAAVEAAITRAVDGQGNPDYEITYRLLPPGEPMRWVYSRGRVAFAGQGGTRHAVRFLGTMLDITERKAAEQRLCASEARFRTITEAMPQMVWSASADGSHDFFNARWYEFTGVPEGSTDGESWRGMFHPQDQAETERRWSRSLQTGEPYDIEYRLRHRSGAYRWVLGRALPIRDEQGEVLRWLGTCTDIDEMKQAQEHRQMLLDELSHRVKNTLAIVQAIAYQTLRNPEAGGHDYAAFEGRLQAVAGAHDMLTREQWTRASLSELVNDARRTSGVEPGRLRAHGEDLALNPKQAVAIAMAFHELSTNALKYGAFSRAGGVVDVSWEVSGGRLRLRWTERGGPPVQEPKREGFGTRLLRRALASELSGSIAIHFPPAGVVCEIEAALPAA